MGKRSPINAVYLTALACASLVLFVKSFYEAVLFSIVVVVTFLISISIVSMIERIADKHVKFICFVLISASLITVLKIVFSFVNIKFVILMADYIDIAIVPCLLLAMVPIYFEDSLTAKAYFVNSGLIISSFVLMLLIFGAITEIAAFGTICDYSLGFEGLEFFSMPYGAFMVLATLAIIFNTIRRAYIKRYKSFRTRVEKYKLQIREIKQAKKREVEKLDKVNEGGNE